MHVCQLALVHNRHNAYGVVCYGMVWVLTIDGCFLQMGALSIKNNQSQESLRLMIFFFSLGTYFKSLQFNWIMRQSVLLKQKQLGQKCLKRKDGTHKSWLEFLFPFMHDADRWHCLTLAVFQAMCSGLEWNCMAGIPRRCQKE